MTSSVINTAISGLRVAQTALSTTGHNIANAGVEGFSRQVVHAETNVSSPLRGLPVGSGARVESIERQVDQFLGTQLRQDTQLANELETFQQNIVQLDQLLADPASGLSGALESFFASVQNGSENPTSIPARQLIISEAQNVATRFNTLHSRFEDLNNGVNAGLQASVAEINSLSSNIALLNREISDQLGLPGGNPNDLLDQRDQALLELSEHIAIQTVEESNGHINVFFGSGQNLTVGGESRRLELVQNASDPNQLDIGFVDNDILQVVDNIEFGGSVGGLVNFRENVLQPSAQEVGQIALVFAETLNTAHSNGIDLENNFGRDIFNDINDVDIARSRVSSNLNNSGIDDSVLRLNINDIDQLSSDEYQIEFINEGVFSVTRLSDNLEITRATLSGSVPFSLEFEGLELVIEQGSFQAGDRFNIQPTRNAAREIEVAISRPQALAFASPILTNTSLSNQGSGSINPGELLARLDQSGNALPLFSQNNTLTPSLLVRFTSDTSYEILDNSNPGNPVALNPPLSNLPFLPGTDNALFSEDPGQTLVRTGGVDIGLPASTAPVIGGGPTNNGYSAETLIIQRAATEPGAAPQTTSVTTLANASARATASQLNNVPGVNANAFTYAELSSTASLTRSSPLQISLNGEALIEYEFDAGSGTFVIAPQVPDPASDEAAFNDYLAARINTNENLQALGVSARATFDANAGGEGIEITASQGDNLEFSLIADSAGPDSVSISDGNNAPVALQGQGAGTSAAVAVGGQIDLSLDAGLSLSANPAVSALFGDTADSNFARSVYFGIQASISGSPRAGDTFTIDFNNDAASDNRNALALAGLARANTLNNGTNTYFQSYASIVETIGIETASAEINRNAAASVLEQTEAQRNAVSGVNLDEEAANLIRFEQVYSANAQVISVARDLFDTLLNSV